MASVIRGSDNFDSGAIPDKVKAWVNFNGTGTVTIRASVNVSSITDNGTGNYTVNFTIAMSDANYAVAITGSRDGVNNDITTPLLYNGVMTSSAVQVASVLSSSYGAYLDAARYCVAIFR